MANVKIHDAATGADETSGGIVGIRTPLVVAEPGHEGARAAYEYQTMAEARIVAGDKPADKYVSYDSALIESDGV